MKWKFGALLIAGVLALCMVPASVVYVIGGGETQLPTGDFYASAQASAAVTNTSTTTTVTATELNENYQTMVMQIDNYIILQNGEQVSMTDTAGNFIAPFVEDGGNTMLPLRFLAESFGGEVGYNDATRASTITITDADGVQTTVELTQGSTEMLVNEEVMTLSCAPMNVDGTFYVPLRAVSEALSWQVGYAPQSQGNFVMVSDKSVAFTDAEVEALRADAQEQLGDSVAQYLSNSLIFRDGLDALLVNGLILELPEGEGIVEQNGAYYLPVSIVVQLSSNQLQTDELGNLMQDGKMVSSDAVEIDGVNYHSVQKFAEVMGQNYTVYDDMIFITGVALDETSAKCASLAMVAADLLPFPTVDASGTPIGEYYVALTFDDGPTGIDGGLTTQLLDGLLERGAHATFFMCGYRLEQYNTYADRYLAEGHELGNHTQSHQNLTEVASSVQTEEIEETNALLEQYAGAAATVMRPPEGAYNSVVKETMAELGLPIIMWSVDTEDWSSRDADTVYNHIIETVKDGDIVLMHDLYGSTITGVLRAIDTLSEQGYAFVTVSELAEIRGVEMEPGEVYSSFYP